MKRREKDKDLLDFEIRFYEKLLEKDPDFVDALIPLAEAYTRRGLKEKGLEVDQQLSRLRSDDPSVWYNLSCSYSVLQRLEESFDAMRKAIALGYDDLSHFKSDSDLANLRRSKYFAELVATLLKLRETVEQ